MAPRDPRVSQRARRAAPAQRGAPRPLQADWAVALLAMAGIGLSTHAALAPDLLANVAPCQALPCVIAGAYALPWGLPLPLVGVAGFSVLLALALAGPLLRALLLPPATLAGAAGAAYLLYLVALARTPCLYCFSVALLMLALVAVALLHRTSRGITRGRLAVLGAAAAVLLVAGAGHLSPTPTNAEEPWARGLARHLAAHGAVLYRTGDCPLCDRQQALFGADAAVLTTVECATPTSALPDPCGGWRIRTFPAWELHGQLHQGFKSLVTLAELSGYATPPR